MSDSMTIAEAKAILKRRAPVDEADPSEARLARAYIALAEVVVRRIIDEAVAAERKACAGLCEEHARRDSAVGAAVECAFAIRARGTAPAESINDGTSRCYCRYQFLRGSIVRMLHECLAHAEWRLAPRSGRASLTTQKG